MLSFLFSMALGVNPAIFLKEVKIELQKVTWPSREQTRKLTIIVIIVSATVAVFVGGLDLLFTKLLGLIV
jgi:preprotein translocase subunit SecE